MGHDCTQGRLLEHIHRHTADGDVLLPHAVVIVEHDVHETKIESIQATGHFPTGQDINADYIAIRIFYQADFTRIEGQPVLVATLRLEVRKTEDQRVLEKESTLLRKKQIEAIEVDLPIVNLSLSKPAVDCGRCHNRRVEVVESIQARLDTVIGYGRISLIDSSRGGRRNDGNAQALTNSEHPFETTRHGEITDEALRVCITPANLLVVPSNTPRKIKAPCIGLGIEIHGVVRNGYFNAPTTRIDRCFGKP